MAEQITEEYIRALVREEVQLRMASVLGGIPQDAIEQSDKMSAGQEPGLVDALVPPTLMEVRYFGVSGGKTQKTQWQIYLPTLKVVLRNGMTVDVDGEEISGAGPWYLLTRIDGDLDDVDPHKTLTSICAAVVPDLVDGAKTNWPVLPEKCKVQFYSNILDAPDDSDPETALTWQICTISGSLVQMNKPGMLVGAMSMGDADMASEATAKSILKDAGEKTLSLNDFRAPTSGTADTGTDKVAIRRVVDTVPTLLFKDFPSGDTTPPSGDDIGTPVELGEHDTGEDALTDTATCDGTNGIYLWVITGVVYDPATSAILYAYRRRMTFTKMGRLLVVGAETKVTVDTPADL